MSDKTEAPKNIWLPKEDSYSWLHATFVKVGDDDIKYIRHDRYIACLDAAISLDHWLFELLNQEIVTPAHCYPEGSDVREAIESAQLALDKWTRFCDGKVEEE